MKLALRQGASPLILLKRPGFAPQVDKISALMEKSRSTLAAYQFHTAFSQIASRLGHKSQRIRLTLGKILADVISAYPQQSLWPMFGLMQSRRPERVVQSRDVFDRVRVSASARFLFTFLPPARRTSHPTLPGDGPDTVIGSRSYTHGADDPQTINKTGNMNKLIADAERFSLHILKLTMEPISQQDKRSELSLSSYPYMRSITPTRMMMPLQDALTSTLPSSAENIGAHNPFPQPMVEIQSIDDRVEIMKSLQKPKKVVFIGTNGKRYPFLCKPEDDLRKDARLMDFNSMINKMLKSASESRRRQLCEFANTACTVEWSLCS